MSAAKEVGMTTILIAYNPTEEDKKFADAALVANVKEVAQLLPIYGLI